MKSSFDLRLRSYARLLGSPSFLTMRFLVSSPLLLGGCVASTSYEQATSTAEVQLEAHKRTAQKLERAEARLAELLGQREALLVLNGELEGDLEQSKNEMSEAELGVLTASKERDEQSQLVSQLRGELARAGAHIKDYEADLNELRSTSEKLTQENATLKAEVRDLSGQKAKLEERISLCSSDATEDESIYEPAEETSPNQHEKEATDQTSGTPPAGGADDDGD